MFGSRLVVVLASIGALIFVHELGHFLVARAFKMRVIAFSMGFGPVLWSTKPKGSETTYQIGLLPFISYVRIAGMNPQDEVAADDPTSYANGSWLARTLTIFAGPFANYLLAVVLVFGLTLAMGREDLSAKVGLVVDGKPAATAGVKTGDEVQTVGGAPVSTFLDLRKAVQLHKGQPTEFVLKRGGVPVTLTITPDAKDGIIGVGVARRPAAIGEAVREALIAPAEIAYLQVRGLGQMIAGQLRPELRGIVGITEDAVGQLENGWLHFTSYIVWLSVSVGVFNLLPVPALDGGRLAFLGYEFVARRRPDASVETRVHLVGLLALLSLSLLLFVGESWRLLSKWLFHGG